jgi:secondary thiamine-phosphate synthase enzyme
MNPHIKISIGTPAHEALVSITNEVSSAVKKLGLNNGILHVFVMHTTCGLTINENADPSVVHDLLSRLNKLIPWNDPNDRHAEGNSAAHLKSSFFGSSISIPVREGRLVLGTWQGLFLGEFDGPRSRTIHITALAADNV